MLKRIVTNAMQDIEKMLDTIVNLKLWVKIKEGWQDNDSIVKKFKNLGGAGGGCCWPFSMKVRRTRVTI